MLGFKACASDHGLSQWTLNGFKYPKLIPRGVSIANVETRVSGTRAIKIASVRTYLHVILQS